MVLDSGELVIGTEPVVQRHGRFVKVFFRVSSSLVWGGETVMLPRIGIMFSLLFPHFVGVLSPTEYVCSRVSDRSSGIRSV